MPSYSRKIGGLATGIANSGATAGQFITVPQLTIGLSYFSWRWSRVCWHQPIELLTPIPVIAKNGQGCAAEFDFSVHFAYVLQHSVRRLSDLAPPYAMKLLGFGI